MTLNCSKNDTPQHHREQSIYLSLVYGNNPIALSLHNLRGWSGNYTVDTVQYIVKIFEASSIPDPNFSIRESRIKKIPGSRIRISIKE